LGRALQAWFVVVVAGDFHTNFIRLCCCCAVCICCCRRRRSFVVVVAAGS